MEQAEAALRAELAGWAATWGLPLPADGDVRVSRVAAATGAPAGENLLQGPEPALQALRSKLTHLLHPSAGQASAVIKLVSKRLAADLLARLRQRFGAGAAAAAEGASGLGDWGVQAVIGWQGCELRLSIPCGQLRAAGLLPVPLLPKLAAVSAEKSLSQLPVELVAEVGNACISVPDLLNLAVNDVVVLKRRLDAPVQLGSPGSSMQLLARMGRTSDGVRAVGLLATTSASPSARAPS